MNKILFTTSWDDGSVNDLKVAEILSHYGMKGTFYIPEKFENKGGKYASYGRRLNEDEIRKIVISHEVGGHSLSHERLTNLTLEQAKNEITGSQDFLKNITGSNIESFAFPGGQFNALLVEEVKRVGFSVVRTTKKLVIEKPKSLMDVTLICQPYPFRKLDSKRLYWGRILDPVRGYTPRQWAFSWQALARKWFKKALREGNYFHLYGHSWELEQYGMWQELESFLKFVKEHDGVTYVSNSEVVVQKAI